ncbi:MAG: alanine racemase [Clostridia bacterium]|nr:alanine racemase [Clostridia bacterium]
MSRVVPEFGGYKLNRAWAEIDLDAIRSNLMEIRKVLRPNTKVCAVVKADAYGHGVKEVANFYTQCGVDYFAVSMADEAIQLRLLGIDKPILILGYTDPVRADELVKHKITQSIFDLDMAKALSEAAIRQNTKIKVHIKIDTGMSRVGFRAGYNAVKAITEISKLPGIIIEGMFTHFATADETDRAYTEYQFDLFEGVAEELDRVGIHIPVRHVANSAAVMMYPETQLDMVRPGIILYGMYPSNEVDKERLHLSPVMSLKANITLIKTIYEGDTVSYGRTFTAPKDMRIATVPIGYADGYMRSLSNKGYMLVNGQRAAVVGRVCMDQCMIDVTNIQGDIRVGDEVVVYGSQSYGEYSDTISIEEVAESCGMINYEMSCIIGKRIPRVYKQGGEIVDVVNYLV